MKIASSNPNKIAEYKKLFPKLRSKIILDTPEVLSDKDNVILYKVKDINNKELIIEDTILEIMENDQWIEIVDIKYKIKELKTINKVKWVVSLGFLKNDKIYISRASIEGSLDPERYVENSFGFDSMFIPDGESKTLYELDQEGLKDKYNMRREAMIDLQSGFYYMVKSLSKMEPWTGEYQK